MTVPPYLIAVWGLAGMSAGLCGAFLFLGRSIMRSLASVQVPLLAHLAMLPAAAMLGGFRIEMEFRSSHHVLVNGIEPFTAALFLTAFIAWILSPVAAGKINPLDGSAGPLINSALFLVLVAVADRLSTVDASGTRRLLFAGMDGQPAPALFCQVLTVTSVIFILTRIFHEHFVQNLLCPTCTCGLLSSEDRWKALCLVMCMCGLAAVLPVTGAMFCLVGIVAVPYLAALLVSGVLSNLLLSSLFGGCFGLLAILAGRWLNVAPGLAGTGMLGLCMILLPASFIERRGGGSGQCVASGEGEQA